MTLVDSSGWIEHLTDGPLAEVYGEHLADPDLLVPTIVLYEVYEFARRETSEETALKVAARLQAGRVVPLDDVLSLEAAEISLRCGLAMADAIIYAVAQHHGALLVTSDDHFADLPGVKYLGR